MPLISFLKSFVCLEILSWRKSHTLLSKMKKTSIRFRLAVLDNPLMGIPWYSPV
jgi:hypothetical protein